MRVTSKGQVTIPQEIRLRLSIEAGSEVGFEVGFGVEGDVVRLVRRSGRRGDAPVSTMRGRRLVMTTAEITSLTPGDG